MSLATAADDGGSEVVRLPQRIPFTMVDNPIIRGMTDYVALGLYLDMLSHPSGWRINIRQLAKTHKQGRQVLTDAMNDLIARGLVFRVRLQEMSGRWSTRTYVCSSPVTLEELREVKQQYNRCVFETSSELSEAINRRADLEADTAPSTGHLPPTTSRARATSSLAAPDTRFPAPGDPDAGRPDTGVPESDDLAAQELESLKKNPPPPPGRSDSVPVAKGEEEEDEDEDQPGGKTSQEALVVRHPDLDRVLGSVASAWPALGSRDLRQLESLLVDALEALPTGQVVEHLVTNTGERGIP